MSNPQRLRRGSVNAPSGRSAAKLIQPRQKQEQADPLAQYRSKRDFSRTAEPDGADSRPGMPADEGGRFVVQMHDARRLHFDLRLEIGGVLKSWAVTRGPSLNPEDKRLAVRTEDHPIDYAHFEGTIPSGSYGAGTVMLWDAGTWAQADDSPPTDSISTGRLYFTLDGERMKGQWLLVRMKGRAGERRENWLLRKIADRYAQTDGELVNRYLHSVSTGRTLAQIKAGSDPQEKLNAKAGKERGAGRTRERTRKDVKKAGSFTVPAFEPVQLATLMDQLPTGENWMHEIKFDGYRCLIAVSHGHVRIYTRSGLDWTDRYAPIAEAVSKLDLLPALIDGEIVVRGADGNPSFSALQEALNGANTTAGRLECFAFDLLVHAGEDIKSLSTKSRKQRLRQLLEDADPPLHLSDHITGNGERLLTEMCRAGQEGIVSKRIDAPYRGRRTRDWVKIKCIRRQEFVIVGFMPSSVRGRAFASLLLAQRAGKRLVYMGKVGTGFSADLLNGLHTRFEELCCKRAALTVPQSESRGASWLRPELVAEIAFAEFTAEGRVRHASFLGLREDKAADQVYIENSQSYLPRAKGGDEAASVANGQDTDLTGPVIITNRDRVIFPQSGQTKGRLADYYRQIAPLMLPFARNRLLSLVRCPQGRQKRCFFQRHYTSGFGRAVLHRSVDESGGASKDYIYVGGKEGLLTCVQMGTIEFHGWTCAVDAIEEPDQLIFDLDPDEALNFESVISASVELRDALSELGLIAYALISGGKGIHLSVPLERGHDWATHKDFARRFAMAMSQAAPDRYTATSSKARRRGKIFIDWMRNQRGATAILPYSARSHAGAPVAVPIAWNEISHYSNARKFTIEDADELSERARHRDLAGWGRAKQPLPCL